MKENFWGKNHFLQNVLGQDRPTTEHSFLGKDPAFLLKSEMQISYISYLLLCAMKSELTWSGTSVSGEGGFGFMIYHGCLKLQIQGNPIYNMQGARAKATRGKKRP